MTTQTIERPVVTDTPHPPTAADIVAIFCERGFVPIQGDPGTDGRHCALGALYRTVGWDGAATMPMKRQEALTGALWQRYGVGAAWLTGLVHGFDYPATPSVAHPELASYHAGYAVGREAARLLFAEPTERSRP